MTNDDKALVERLEEWEWTLRAVYKAGDLGTDEPAIVMGEASSRIEALSAENERLQSLCDLNAVPTGIIEDRGRMEERAAIVAWLRRHKIGNFPFFVVETLEISNRQKALVDAIEAGEHLK